MEMSQFLLSNAIKYTETGGVQLRTYTKNGWSVLEVEDSGIGVDPDEVARLFEPFHQESEGASRAYEGTGIGLAVTKRAVEQMEGSIEVETEKEKGSQFTVRLPRVEDPSAQHSGDRRVKGHPESS